MLEVQDMLSQQMRSGNCQLEDGDWSLSLFPSNSVGNYNHHHPHLLSNEHTRIVNAFLINDNYALSPGVHTVPPVNVFESLNTPISLLPGAQPVPSATSDLDFNERLAIGVGDFSQSIACIATRFGECSSTSLDKLWYTYSYIYKPTSTTVPDIRYKFESLHASPFWLLAILKTSTSFISIPLCTTSSTLHLLAFLESTVPSFPPFLWTLYVIFFLSPIGTVAHDTVYQRIFYGRNNSCRYYYYTLALHHYHTVALRRLLQSTCQLLRGFSLRFSTSLLLVPSVVKLIFIL